MNTPRERLLTFSEAACVIASGTVADICREAAEAARLRRRLFKAHREIARLREENQILAAALKGDS